MNELKYYRNVKKGDLFYRDLLTISLDSKTVLYARDVDTGDIRPAGFHFKSCGEFIKIYKKYIDDGFTLIEKDGIQYRCSKEEICNALDLHTVVSTYADLCKLRPEHSNYFSLTRIENAINSYLNGGMSFFDLKFWAQLFSLAVEESFEYPLTFQNAFQLAVIKKLDEYLMDGKHLVDENKVREHLSNAMPEIYALREKYYKMLGLQTKAGKKKC